MSTRPLARLSRIGIMAKPRLTAASPSLLDISTWLTDHGVDAVFESETAALMPPAAGRRTALKAELPGQVDMILVLGGDGTLLAMADTIAEAGLSIPILGVNFGSLGFLTEVTLPELFRSLEAAVSGAASVEERLMLRSTVQRAGAIVHRGVALNDAVITKAARARMIDLTVSVGDEFVTRVRADGLIIATPTGSTAYNLSAGGPIVQPSVDALLLTPIAPHTLTNRPIVIPATATVRVQPNMNDRDEVFLTFDGQSGLQIQPGDELTVDRNPTPLHLIKPSTRSYFEVLRTKLKWGER